MAIINYKLKPFGGDSVPASTTVSEAIARPVHASPPLSPALSERSESNGLLPPVASPLERINHAKGAEWCRILREALTPDDSGKTLVQRFSLAEVATMVGTSAPTLHRLVKKFGRLPIDQLTPERLAPTAEGGRECDWQFLMKDEAFKRKLLEIYVATMGASSARATNDRRTAKIATALRNFAYEPECPEKLRPRLLTGYQPVPFVNWLRAAVTPEMEAKVRGPKHYQLHGPSSVRDWTCRLPNGDRFEMPAAYTLSMDDMSSNHPFYVELALSERSESKGSNTILSRQGLYAWWAKHKLPQSVELVARLRESYTAADILRAFYKMCLALGGVPPFVEFEQGIWKARKISGWHHDGEWIVEEQIERPGMANEAMNTITSGLGMCGVKVLYKTKAHQKHIETHFNSFQDILAITARQYLCIGRYAGEFEKPGKQLRRVRAGSHHPRDLGFASQHQLADCIYEAFRRIWEMPSTMPGKTRYEAHWDDLSKVGLLPLTSRLFASCLPGELRKTTVRGGYIQVESRGQFFQFRAEEFMQLGDGYELYYKFDDTDPNLGAAIYNRTSPSNTANFQGWKMDEFMFVAPREIPGPKLEVKSAPAGVQISTVEELYGEGAVDRGDLVRRRQDKFVSTQFRAMPRPGQNAVRSASARDGRGNVVDITNQPVVSSVEPPADSALVGRDSVEPINSTSPSSALPPRPVTKPENQRRKLSRQAMQALANLTD